MIVIIADEGKQQIGLELQQTLITHEIQVEYISLDRVNVKPCVSCGGCTYKTYGKCVVRDDGDWIYPKVIGAEAVIFVTPITFGSYSFKIKRVFDKFALIMDRHYMVEQNELVKAGMKGKQFKFFVLGKNENCLEEEIKVFKRLHQENIIITRGTGKVFIIDSVLTSEMKENIAKEVLRV